LAGHVSEILRCVVDHVEPSHIPTFFFVLFNIPDGLKRKVTCLLRIRARRQVLIDLPFKVIAQFFVEFLFNFVPREQRTKAEADDVD
jgi:hypothetical protein